MTELPGISAPARRALASIQVACLEDLAKHSRANIAALHGMGPNALEKLDAAMKHAGLKFLSEAK